MDALMTHDTAEIDGIKVFVAVVNPEFAKHLLRSTEYDRQRHLRATNIERLAGEMRRGWYVKGTPLTFACMPNGDTFLLNGQHSLNAVVNTGIPMSFVFIFHRVSTMEEVAHIYSVLDIHHPRTWGDAMRAAGLAEKHGIPPVWHQPYAGSIRVMMAGFNARSQETRDGLMVSREFQLRQWESWAPMCRLFIDCMGRSEIPIRPFKRSGVLSVGMVTLRYNQPLAEIFWRGAAADDGLKKGDPRKALVDFLRPIKSHTREQRQMITHACAIAWNHFRVEEQLHKILPSTVAKVAIEGTDWDGGDYDPFSNMVKDMPKKQIAAQYREIETGVLYEASGARTPITQFVGKWNDTPAEAAS